MLGIDIETDFITRNNIESIWKYIKTEDKNIAKIFYMHFMLDMTLKEIADQLEQNVSTVKSNLYRTMKKLKKNFGGEAIEK